MSGSAVDVSRGVESEALTEWTRNPPSGCAVGSSGPTLNPRDSIRFARLSAIEALAANSLAIDVQTVSGVGPDGAFEIAAQSLSGSLENARLVAVWADVDHADGFGRRVSQVYALACWPDATVRDLPEPAYPSWLLEPRSDEGEICATGIGGPTWNRDEQRDSALRDARLALAVALESRVEKRIFDDGQGVARIARRIEPSASAVARAGKATELERDWYDENGVGPVGLPGVLYGFACIEG